MTRTHDLLITNQLHYRLCYTSDLNIIIYKTVFVNSFLKFQKKYACRKKVCVSVFYIILNKLKAPLQKQLRQDLKLYLSFYRGSFSSASVLRI